MIGKKERDFSLDVLRVLACFLVILLHVGVFYYQTKDSSNNVVIVRDSSAYVVGYMVSWCRTSVPLFFLMSGYLLLPVKMSLGDFFHRRFSRILYPFLFWCVVYAVGYAVIKGSSLTQFLTNIMMIPVDYGTRIGHLWYVYTLSGLYLLAPIISPWLENVSKKVLQAASVKCADDFCCCGIGKNKPRILVCFFIKAAHSDLFVSLKESIISSSLPESPSPINSFI